jgi:hypothetical protein
VVGTNCQHQFRVRNLGNAEMNRVMKFVNLGQCINIVGIAAMLIILPLLSGCGNAAAEQAAFKRVREAGGTLEFSGYGPKISFRLSKVTDDDLACLEGLPRIALLDLQATEITDAGVEHILKIHKLERIDIKRTGITETGRDRLKQRFPEITFVP